MGPRGGPPQNDLCEKRIVLIAYLFLHTMSFGDYKVADISLAGKYFANKIVIDSEMGNL